MSVVSRLKSACHRHCHRHCQPAPPLQRGKPIHPLKPFKDCGGQIASFPRFIAHFRGAFFYFTLVLVLTFEIQTFGSPCTTIMVYLLGWFGSPDGNETSRSLAGLKGKQDDAPGDTTVKTLSEDFCDIQNYVHDSVQRGAYVDFEQLRLMRPSWEAVEPNFGPFLDWTTSWQKYRSMVLEVQPEREAELQQYGDSIENLFLLLRPRAHSFIVELDKAERKRLGGFMEDPKTLSPGEVSDEPLVLGEARGETLLVQVRRRPVSLGGQALSASAVRLTSVYSLTFWREIARNLFKLVTFSAFA